MQWKETLLSILKKWESSFIVPCDCLGLSPESMLLHQMIKNDLRTQKWWELVAKRHSPHSSICPDAVFSLLIQCCCDPEESKLLTGVEVTFMKVWVKLFIKLTVQYERVTKSLSGNTAVASSFAVVFFQLCCTLGSTETSIRSCASIFHVLVSQYRLIKKINGGLDLKCYPWIWSQVRLWWFNLL